MDKIEVTVTGMEYDRHDGVPITKTKFIGTERNVINTILNRYSYGNVDGCIDSLFALREQLQDGNIPENDGCGCIFEIEYMGDVYYKSDTYAMITEDVVCE